MNARRYVLMTPRKRADRQQSRLYLYTFVFIPSWKRMKTGRCRTSCAFCDLTSCPRRPPFDNELRRILVEVHHDHLHYLTDKLFA